MKHLSTLPRSARVIAITGAIVLIGGIAYAAATNWLVSLNAGSSAQSQSATIANISIAAAASPSATSLLYPGGTGDAVMTITNSNSFPVTITAVQLPTNTTNADGYSDSALQTSKSGCASATPSGVIWNFSSATSGSSHSLTSPLTVAGNGTLTVTLTNDVSMTAAAPAACANTFFKLPALTGVTASGGVATATSSPATDAWAS